MCRYTYIYLYYSSKLLPSSRDIKKLFALEKILQTCCGAARAKFCGKGAVCAKSVMNNPNGSTSENTSEKSFEKSKKNKKNSSKPKNKKNKQKNKNTRENQKKQKKQKNLGIWEKWPPRPFPETLGFFVFFCFLDVFLFFFSRLFWLLWFYRKLRRFFPTYIRFCEKTH